MRRVVVTGLGMVSPLASGVTPSWERLLNGERDGSLAKIGGEDNAGR